MGRKLGRPQRFDKELRVYVTQDQFDAVSDQAAAEQREVSNMVRVLLNEALDARKQPESIAQ